MPRASATRSERPVLAVGELIAGLKGLLEDAVGRVRVVGEISNLHRARSGHVYFTLKDDAGQIRAALFRGNASRVRFELEEGLEVVAEAEVSVYAARGDLQLIVRALEPRGIGALQLAFEQLRERLAAAGFFDPERKRPLPPFPRRIGVVTSPTSAAVRDVLKVAGRRFPAIPILIAPTLVQGDAAPAQIARAIERVAGAPEVDLVLVVRGGGSLEDLWAFNTEAVARAIHDCPVPVVAGVGHETDLTIADLVADVRAPTPSAAAMQALPDREDLARRVRRDTGALAAALDGRLESARARIGALGQLLAARSPQARVRLARTREARARAAMEVVIRRRVDRQGRRAGELAGRLDAFDPRARVALARTRAARARAAADVAIQRLVERRGGRFGELAGRLHALSPLAVLGRGYALARRRADGRIVRRPADVAVGDDLDLQLAEGTIGARVLEAGAGGDGDPGDEA